MSRAPRWSTHLDLGRASALVLTMDDPVLQRAADRARARRASRPADHRRARDARHAAELYRAGATDAVPETLESSLQLSEAVLVELGVAMGPVIASIHEKRAELRARDQGRQPSLGPRPALPASAERVTRPNTDGLTSPQRYPPPVAGEHAP